MDRPLATRMRPRNFKEFVGHHHLLGEGKPLTLYGAVRIPQATDRTQPLTLWERPWERPDAPGIHLQAPLGIDLNAGGKLIFNQTALRIYSPPSTDWQTQNGTFQPNRPRTGSISSCGARAIRISLVSRAPRCH